MWIALKNCFSKFWKIAMGTLYLKNHLILEINFYTFKVATTKISWKLTMFEKSFYTFKALKKNMWTSGFFCFKCHFSLSNVHQMISIFLWTLIYSTRRDPCVQNIQKVKIHIHFKFWNSNILKHYYNFEFIIMVQSKVIDLSIT